MTIEEFIIELKSCAKEYSWGLFPRIGSTNIRKYVIRGMRKNRLYCPIEAVVTSKFKKDVGFCTGGKMLNLPGYLIGDIVVASDDSYDEDCDRPDHELERLKNLRNQLTEIIDQEIQSEY